MTGRRGLNGKLDLKPSERPLIYKERQMRINVYSQELTTEVKRIEKAGVPTEDGSTVTYSAVQLMLHSSPMLHHTPEDDDRSAVTFWLPKSMERRNDFADTLERMAKLVRCAQPETGCD
jgi:hypothetical protein